MNLQFVVTHGALLIDAAVADAIGDHMEAERIRYEAYSMVVRMAHALGRGDVNFHPASFLRIYPEYKKGFWEFFHLGRKFAQQQQQRSIEAKLYSDHSQN